MRTPSMTALVALLLIGGCGDPIGTKVDPAAGRGLRSVDDEGNELESRVVQFDGADADMDAAAARARDSFRHFWREVFWEGHRVVPALEFAAVKAPFWDPLPAGSPADAEPAREFMWVTDVEFDGATVSGTLINTPNHVTSVKAGDTVRLPLARVMDWMINHEGKGYGAYTVQLLRSRMSEAERKEHDEAWGVDFGDPAEIRLDPTSEGATIDQDHPMAAWRVEKLTEQLEADPGIVKLRLLGKLQLHAYALGGCVPVVEQLLKAGADVNAKTDDGKTALQLAETMGWTRVVEVLKKHGAR